MRPRIRESNERRYKTRKRKKMVNGCRAVCVLFKAGLHFGHHLEGERQRDKRGKRVYKAAAAGGVKNRQLHRQKQDAESIHF